MTTAPSRDKTMLDEKNAAARRVDVLVAELSEIVTLLRSHGADCEDLMDYARGARDNLDNLSIELRKRSRRAQFVDSMTA